MTSKTDIDPRCGIIGDLLEYDQKLAKELHCIKNKTQFAPGEKPWENELRKLRLRLKFKYYVLKSGNRNARRVLLNDESLRNASKDEHHLWMTYTKFWDKLEDLEERAYLSRISQHVDEELVHELWYDDSEEFKEWTKHCYDNLKRRKEELLSIPLEIAAAERTVTERVLGELAATDEQAYAKRLQLLKEMQNETVNALSEEAQDWLYKGLFDAIMCLAEILYQIVAGNQAQVESFREKYFADDLFVAQWMPKIIDFFLRHNEKLEYAHISKSCDVAFRQRIKTRTFEAILEKIKSAISTKKGKDEIVHDFLISIRDSSAFRCEVCDFLEVKTIQGGGEVEKRLGLFASTVKGALPKAIEREMRRSPRKAYKELRERDSYGEYEGISGSIFAAPKNRQWFHVGTNCLEKDYRMSEPHKDVYEDKYGIAVHDFWLFPIYENQELKYALRVVNKLDPVLEFRAEGGWSYLTRLQLCELARCFGDLLRLYTRLSSMASLLENMKNTLLEIEWLSDRTLKNVIKHLMKVAVRKVESRRIGCTIMVVSKEYKERVRVGRAKLGGTESDLDLADMELDSIIKYYDAISSRTTCIVVGEDLRCIRVKSFSSYEELKKSVQRFTNRYLAIAFHLLEGTATVQIIEGGSDRGEIYFNERLSEWRFRHYETILSTIHNHVEHIEERNVVKKVLELATSLSRYGFGALIVLGDEPIRWREGVNYSIQDICLPEEGIQIDDLTELIYLARKDGATVITTDGKLIYTNVKINNTTDIENYELKEYDLRRKIYDERGTRHKTAVLTSMECKKALIFVVSQNKGITILCNEAHPNLPIQI